MHQRMVSIYLFLMLTGCAPFYAQVSKEFLSLPVSNNTIDQVTFEPLDPQRQRTFNMSEGQKVMGFPTGASYFRGFDIGNAGGKVMLKSYLTGPGMIPNSYLFVPFVDIYDKDKKKTRTVTISKDVEWKQGMRSPYIELVFEVSKNEKYLVLYTERSLLDRTFRYTFNNSYHTSGSAVSISGGGQNAVNLPFSPTGKIEIELK